MLELSSFWLAVGAAVAALGALLAGINPFIEFLAKLFDLGKHLKQDSPVTRVTVSGDGGGCGGLGLVSSGIIAAELDHLLHSHPVPESKLDTQDHAPAMDEPAGIDHDLPVDDIADGGDHGLDW